MERGSLVCLGSAHNCRNVIGGGGGHVEELQLPKNHHRLHPEILDNGVHANGIQSQYGSFSSLAQNEPTSSLMRRSCTTDEFHRVRRRLPRRPDELGEPIDLLPQSKSMYERALQFGYATSSTSPPEDYTSKEMKKRPPNLALQTTIDTIRWVPYLGKYNILKVFTLKFGFSIVFYSSYQQSSGMETRTINSTTGTNGIGSAGAAGKIDPCAHLETPISPHIQNSNFSLFSTLSCFSFVKFLAQFLPFWGTVAPKIRKHCAPPYAKMHRILKLSEKAVLVVKNDDMELAEFAVKFVKKKFLSKIFLKFFHFVIPCAIEFDLMKMRSSFGGWEI
nr:protein F56D12.3 [imported] - Caenorhabditis elegans [Caenorhabditis elegans]